MKESACNAGDTSSIPGSGRSPGEGNGNPLQYSCLGNLMDRRDWRVTVRGVAKSYTWLSDWNHHYNNSFVFRSSLRIKRAWPQAGGQGRSLRAGDGQAKTWWKEGINSLRWFPKDAIPTSRVSWDRSRFSHKAGSWRCKVKVIRRTKLSLKAQGENHSLSCPSFWWLLAFFGLHATASPESWLLFTWPPSSVCSSVFSSYKDTSHIGLRTRSSSVWAHLN